MPKSSENSGRRVAGAKRQLDFQKTAHNNNNSSSEFLGVQVTGQDTASKSSGDTPQQQQQQQKKARALGQQSISFVPVLSSTPAKEFQPKTSVVTPDEEEQKQRTEAEFVPVYIHKNLGYHTKGTVNLSETSLKAFSLICQTHIIPDDLQSSRVHGPLSGSSYEERVLQKYMLRQLQPKPEYQVDGIEDVSSSGKICIACAEQGHIRDDCPSLL